MRWRYELSNDRNVKVCSVAAAGYFTRGRREYVPVGFTPASTLAKPLRKHPATSAEKSVVSVELLTSQYRAHVEAAWIP